MSDVHVRHDQTVVADRSQPAWEMSRKCRGSVSAVVADRGQPAAARRAAAHMRMRVHGASSADPRVRGLAYRFRDSSSTLPGHFVDTSGPRVAGLAYPQRRGRRWRGGRLFTPPRRQGGGESSPRYLRSCKKKHNVKKEIGGELAEVREVLRAGANGGEGENLGPLPDGRVPRQDDLRAEYADMRA